MEKLKVSRPISWGEMDLFGHLNNVHYFRYMEDARIAFMHQVNFFSFNLQCIVVKNTCEYFSPVTYPDELITETFIKHIGNTSFTMIYEITSQSKRVIVGKGESVIVCVEPINFIKTNLPNEIRNKLESFYANQEIMEA
ncbi:acyl-CoA thioesterase [Acinetobacter radioresistens]|uniref:acyl-CoA thioesterase n=1 Tax=Acinetobacter radioresistens TaxID=40216 RepID=UPI00094624BD|nr:acyl-CoA thioesterase [Acinetobacter radioresistens]